MIPVESIYAAFYDLDGQPLQNGYVYIGLVNQNPQTAPRSVYWDFGGTQPAAQPLRVLNGFLHRTGTPANIFVTGDYSITVRSQDGTLICTARSAADAGDLGALLGSDDGAEVVGWIQTGAGAVSRTVASKLADDVDTRDFGVDPANTASENDAAIANALVVGKRLWFEPRETILTSAPIYLRYSEQILEFNNCVISYGGVGNAIDGVLESATSYPQNISIRDLVLALTASGASGINNRFSYSNMRNVTIRPQNTNQTAHRLTSSTTAFVGVIQSVYEAMYIVGNSSSNQTGTICDQVAQVGPNGNVWMGGRTTGCTVPWSLRGFGNQLLGIGIEGVTIGNYAMFITNAAGASGIGCNANTILINNMEGDAGANGFGIDDYATGSFIVVKAATGFAGGTFYPLSDVVNANNNTAFFNDGYGPVPSGYRFANTSSSDAKVQDRYLEKNDYVAAPTSLTVVGTPTYTFHATYVGNRFKFNLRVQSDTTTASTANTTYFTITGMPAPVFPSTCTAVNTLTVASYGVGLITTDGRIYTPTWGAVADVTISGEFETAT